MEIPVPAVGIFLREEQGATAVEYAVMVALIAAAIVAIVFFVGLQVKEGLNLFCTALSNVANVGACS